MRLAALLTAALTAAAGADIVEVELSGEVTSGSLAGAEVSATFRYDTEAGATGSAGQVTNYPAASLLSFVLDGNAWTSASWGVQKVTRTALSDQYRTEWGSPSSPTLAELIFEFTGPAGTLDSSALPTVAEFAGFTSRLGAFRLTSTSQVNFSFDTASARVVPVPLPAALWAGLAGLALAAGARRAILPPR